jgi:hypothetical protein
MEVTLVGDARETLRALLPLLERKESRDWLEDWSTSARRVEIDPSDAHGTNLAVSEGAICSPLRFGLSADEGAHRPFMPRTRKSRVGRPSSLLLVAFVVTLAMGAAPARAQAGVEADEVIAAMLSRFPQFVEWPDSVLEGRESVEICVAEPDPFGPLLDRFTVGEVLNGRSMTVRRVAVSERIDGCHVLFVSSAVERARRLLVEAAEQPVLTVGEGSDFLDLGGIIGLRVVGQRLRFEVSTAAASRAGLRLSSQLLALAIDVRSRP